MDTTWEDLTEAQRAVFADRFLDSEAKYGLRVGAVVEMLESQGHRCAICRKVFTYTHYHGQRRRQRDWHIDHCHASGKVRGLLCGGCNTKLGRLGDQLLPVMGALVKASPDRGFFDYLCDADDVWKRWGEKVLPENMAA